MLFISSNNGFDGLHSITLTLQVGLHFEAEIDAINRINSGILVFTVRQCGSVGC